MFSALNLPKPVWLIALAQALGMTSSPLMVLIGGLVGVKLAPSVELSTLPVALMVVGSALTSMPAVFIMQKIGRRKALIGATLVALTGSAVAYYSLAHTNFIGFCIATTIMGVHLAFVQQFRFAALEWVSVEKAGATASVVLLAGLVAAYLGPEMGVIGKFLVDIEFGGSFLLLAICHSLLLLMLFFIPFVKPVDQQENTPARSYFQLLKSPAVGAAIAAAAVAFGAMSLIMTATPVSMTEILTFPLEEAKSVIQSHIVAMFLPSLFTAFLFRYFKIMGMIVAGITSFTMAITVALLDQSYWGYWIALVLLGVGWNFMFSSGTTLLMQSSEPHERFKLQSINEVFVFGTQGIMSLSSGWLVYSYGWNALNLIALPLLLISVVITLRWYLFTKNEANSIDEKLE